MTQVTFYMDVSPFIILDWMVINCPQQAILFEYAIRNSRYPLIDMTSIINADRPKFTMSFIDPKEALVFQLRWG